MSVAVGNTPDWQVKCQVGIVDDKDRKLLALLKCDGRRPIVALARDIGLSRSATQERLAKLVSSGAVKGFTTIEGGVDAEVQEAYFLVLREKGKTCAQVVPKLKAIAFINSIHSVAGAADIVIYLRAPCARA